MGMLCLSFSYGFQRFYCWHLNKILFSLWPKFYYMSIDKLLLWSDNIFYYSWSVLDEPPPYYILQIHDYEEFNNAVEKYESEVFEAKGCKWYSLFVSLESVWRNNWIFWIFIIPWTFLGDRKLVLYPRGNKGKEVPHHISLYLALADSVEHEEVYAVFCLYLLDQEKQHDFIFPAPGIFSKSLVCKEINFYILLNKSGDVSIFNPPKQAFLKIVYSKQKLIVRLYFKLRCSGKGKMLSQIKAWMGFWFIHSYH